MRRRYPVLVLALGSARGSVCWWNGLFGAFSLPLMLTGDTSRQEEVFHFTTPAGYDGISASESRGQVLA